MAYASPFGREEIVLLVAFDPETFDVISARWETDETEAGYTQLLTDVTNKIEAVHVKGLYADGDNGLVARNYHHSATSFHLYNKDMPDLQNSPFLRNEGLLFYPNNQ